MKINLAFIGAGTVSREHMINLQANDHVEIVAVVDPNEALADECAREFAIPRTYTDFRNMLGELQAVDAALVAVPNHLHSGIVCGLLQRGVHTLVEKPMALNSAEAEEIIAARAKGNNALMMVSHNKRFLKGTERMKELVASGELGNIYRIKAEWIRCKGIPGWGSWFTQKRFSGGGALIDIGCMFWIVFCTFLVSPSLGR